jgi:hypothetical protein
MGGSQDGGGGGGACDEVKCGQHGSCSASGGSATCNCDSGYENKGGTTPCKGECAAASLL